MTVVNTFGVIDKRQPSLQTLFLKLDFAAFLREGARVTKARGEAIASDVTTNVIAIADVGASINLFAM